MRFQFIHLRYYKYLPNSWPKYPTKHGDQVSLCRIFVRIHFVDLCPSQRHSRPFATIGRRHGGGHRPQRGKHFDGFDGFDGVDEFDDFRVQGKQRHSKPKKNKRNRRKMGQEHSYISDDTPPLTLSERSLTAVADMIKSGKARRIVVMTGAGISTSAGSSSHPRSSPRTQP